MCAGESVVDEGAFPVRQRTGEILRGEDFVEGDGWAVIKFAAFAELGNHVLNRGDRVGEGGDEQRRQRLGGGEIHSHPRVVGGVLGLHRQQVLPLSHGHGIGGGDVGAVVEDDHLVGGAGNGRGIAGGLRLGGPAVGEANAAGAVGVIIFIQRDAGGGGVGSGGDGSGGRSSGRGSCGGGLGRRRGLHQLFPVGFWGIGAAEDDGNGGAAVVELAGDDAANRLVVIDRAEGCAAAGGIMCVLISGADLRAVAEIGFQIGECRHQGSLHGGDIGLLGDKRFSGIGGGGKAVAAGDIRCGGG